jgi:hypothetical protein
MTLSIGGWITDISHYKLFFGFFLPYRKDCVPFELIDSAALIWSNSCGSGGANSISKFDHHNINGGAVDNT